MLWLLRSGGRPHARTLVGSCLSSCCKLFPACFLDGMSPSSLRKTRRCSLPLNMQPTRRRCKRKHCYLHQFRGQHAHRRLPPHKSVSSDSCRWSVRLLPRLPRKQFPTRRRCVHVFVHPAERQPKVTFLIQNDQRHHAISPETPAAWQPSTCKRQRQGPALLRAQ